MGRCSKNWTVDELGFWVQYLAKCIIYICLSHKAHINRSYRAEVIPHNWMIIYRQLCPVHQFILYHYYRFVYILLIIMSSPISCEYKGKIAVITINKDHKLNALNQDEYYQIARYMREIATHDEVFITVLTGKGTFQH